MAPAEARRAPHDRKIRQTRHFADAAGPLLETLPAILTITRRRCNDPCAVSGHPCLRVCITMARTFHSMSTNTRFASMSAACSLTRECPRIPRAGARERARRMPPRLAANPCQHGKVCQPRFRARARLRGAAIQGHALSDRPEDHPLRDGPCALGRRCLLALVRGVARERSSSPA